jgi:predicted dehydrogenase
VDPIKDFIRKVHFAVSGGELEQVKGTFPSGTDGMIATRVAEAVEESIQTGEAVELSP